MIYTSPALSFEDQADLLICRGLSCNKSELVSILKSVSYGDEHKFLPVFRVTEIMSFGSLFTLFRGIAFSEKKQIARRYGVMAPVMDNWIKTLNYIRNICAHHGRLYNKELSIRPMIPKAVNNPEWHSPLQINNRHLFSIITILNYLLKEIAPQSNWFQRFTDLLEKYDDISVQDMGFPEDWMKHKIWNGELKIHGK